MLLSIAHPIGHAIHILQKNLTEHHSMFYYLYIRSLKKVNMTAEPRVKKNLAQIASGTDSGSHNFPCPVCNHEQALLDITAGYQPCLECCSHGWRLLQLKKLTAKMHSLFGLEKYYCLVFSKR